MTEEEWQGATDPTPMLRELSSKIRERKSRLFAVGCCRRAWEWMESHGPIRACVEFAEGYADGIGAKKRLKKLIDANERAFARYGDKPGEDLTVAFAASAARVTCDQDSRNLGIGVCNGVGWVVGRCPSADYPAQATLLRDIFGNPFRPVVADPAWLTPTVRSIAGAIYNDRAFDRLPILADALEEAGCTNADVLLHCRQPGEHVRGCWVVDLMLGKGL